MPAGTCPGGGRCNGTGGAEGCGGCPAYNNRISKAAQLNNMESEQQGCRSQSKQQTPAEDDPAAPVDIAALRLQNPSATVVIACQNCGTTTTPLWRRDESGHTICNACGKHVCPNYSLKMLIFRRSLLQTPRCPSTCQHEEIYHQATKKSGSKHGRRRVDGGIRRL